jgi:hypothetical protein
MNFSPSEGRYELKFFFPFLLAIPCLAPGTMSSRREYMNFESRGKPKFAQRLQSHMIEIKQIFVNLAEQAR